jgi:hypothetical protein
VSGKVQVSLWLRKDLKRIVEDEEINLTQWVNDTLEKYFSVATVEDVTKEIVASKLKTVALEKRRADMIAQGVAESAETGMKNGVEEELRELYRVRRQNKVKQIHDRDWLGSPKNLTRLRAIGWQIDEALFKLKEWYDGVQKHNDS